MDFMPEFFLGRVSENLANAYDYLQDVIGEYDGEDVDLDELEELEGAIAEALKMARAIVLPEAADEA